VGRPHTQPGGGTDRSLQHRKARCGDVSPVNGRSCAPQRQDGSAFSAADCPNPDLDLVASTAHQRCDLRKVPGQPIRLRAAMRISLRVRADSNRRPQSRGPGGHVAVRVCRRRRAGGQDRRSRLRPYGSGGSTTGPVPRWPIFHGPAPRRLRRRLRAEAPLAAATAVDHNPSTRERAQTRPCSRTSSSKQFQRESAE